MIQYSLDEDPTLDVEKIITRKITEKLKTVKENSIDYFELSIQKEEIYQRVYFQVYEIQELKLQQLETD